MTPAALTFQTPPRWRAGDIAAAVAAQTGTADAAPSRAAAPVILP